MKQIILALLALSLIGCSTAEPMPMPNMVYGENGRLEKIRFADKLCDLVVLDAPMMRNSSGLMIRGRIGISTYTRENPECN